MDEDQGDKTEDPTPFRIEQAERDGQFGFSGDFIGGIVLLIGVLYFWFAGSLLFERLGSVTIARTLRFGYEIEEPNYLIRILSDDMGQIIGPMIGLLAPLFLTIIAVGGFQTKFRISFKPFEFDPSKLSPQKGIKRIFSMRSVVKTVIVICKMLVITAVILTIVSSRYYQVESSSFLGVNNSISLGWNIILWIATAVACLVFAFGLIDLAFQKWKHMQDLRMTKDQIKKEHKENMGDPRERARLRKLHNEIMKNANTYEATRTKATFVVANPTHFAVAIEYRRGQSGAPKVVAKGVDDVARTMFRIAKKHKIHVVRRKMVARFLYYNVDVDKEIPVELYSAVAEIISYIRNRPASAA